MLKSFIPTKSSLNLVLLFSLLILTGCSIFPPQNDIKTNYFDIGFPKDNKSKLFNTPVIVDRITTTGPYYEKMVFRTSPTHLEYDEFNRWISPPSKMLKRYFILALENENIKEIDLNNKTLKLNAEILCIEADLNKKLITMILRITIYQGDNQDVEHTEIINIQESMPAVSANQFAEKLKIAVNSAIDKTISALKLVEANSKPKTK
ncbi:MAG TPA: hypothetical protein QF753_10190 [Victivallales bacterium]|nr:hypothetical protein [Victivallales bacterium]